MSSYGAWVIAYYFVVFYVTKTIAESEPLLPKDDKPDDKDAEKYVTFKHDHTGLYLYRNGSLLEAPQSDDDKDESFFKIDQNMILSKILNSGRQLIMDVSNGCLELKDPKYHPTKVAKVGYWLLKDSPNQHWVFYKDRTIGTACTPDYRLAFLYCDVAVVIPKDFLEYPKMYTWTITSTTGAANADIWAAPVPEDTAAPATD